MAHKEKPAGQLFPEYHKIINNVQSKCITKHINHIFLPSFYNFISTNETENKQADKQVTKLLEV